MLAPNPTDFT